MIEHHALAIVQPVLELIGTCRPSSLRTATALSAVLDYPEFQVATALIYMESLGLIQRQPHTSGQVAWRLASQDGRRPFQWHRVVEQVAGQDPVTHATTSSARR